MTWTYAEVPWCSLLSFFVPYHFVNSGVLFWLALCVHGADIATELSVITAGSHIGALKARAHHFAFAVVFAFLGKQGFILSMLNFMCCCCTYSAFLSSCSYFCISNKEMITSFFLHLCIPPISDQFSKFTSAGHADFCGSFVLLWKLTICFYLLFPVFYLLSHVCLVCLKSFAKRL